MTRLVAAALSSAVALSGCVSRASPAADALMVRLDVIERGLLGTETALCSRPNADADPLSHIARQSVTEAEEALDLARWSTARWQAGDGRGVDERLRLLALRINTLLTALEVVGMAPPAGLTGTLPPAAIERPNSNAVATDPVSRRAQ